MWWPLSSMNLDVYICSDWGSSWPLFLQSSAPFSFSSFWILIIFRLVFLLLSHRWCMLSSLFFIPFSLFFLWLDNFNWSVLELTYSFFCLVKAYVSLIIVFFKSKICLVLIYVFHFFVELLILFLHYFPVLLNYLCSLVAY